MEGMLAPKKKHAQKAKKMICSQVGRENKEKLKKEEARRAN